jgi:hypothetical protein
LLAAHPADVPDGPTGLDERSEAVRWFVVPAACIATEAVTPG